MEPHAVPRQITTFEFKLIGFLTLKEFAYLIVFAGFAAVAYFTAPFELAKYLSAGVVFGIGAFLAFFKYNERSIDVWIKNLAIKLFSSSQYYYHKHNEPPSFLRDIIYDRQIAKLHVDAQKKLSGYLKTGQNALQPSLDKHEVEPVIESATNTSHEEVALTTPPSEIIKQVAQPTETEITNSTGPVFSGLVKNSKDLPLPNILVYVKNKDGQVARILKTNNHGVFSTTRPFDNDSYIIEPKDSSNRFFFDTINIDPQTIAAGTTGAQPLIIRSKEVL